MLCETAYDFALTHEYYSIDDNSKYDLSSIGFVTTIKEATNMDLINNERGLRLGQAAPFYYSNDMIAQIVLNDMNTNPNEYMVLYTETYYNPIK